MRKEYWKFAGMAVFLLAAGFFYWLSTAGNDKIVLPARSAAQDSDLEEISGQAGTAGAGCPEAVDPGQSEAVDTASQEIGGDWQQGGMQEMEAERPSCFVHICGEVVSPGVYELKEGSRIFEAVEKAGGFTEDAAGESINLAAKVTDGMRVVILSTGEAESLAAAGVGLPFGAGTGTGGVYGRDGVGMSPGPDSEGKTQLVNLNTATKEQLMTLSGIGESRAEQIIRYRETHGSFRKIEDIMKIPGIKDAAFEKIKDCITV